MSGQDWPVGTVAMVAPREAAEPSRAFFDGRRWCLMDFDLVCTDPADVRPLVVLDLDERRLLTVAAILRENMAPSALLVADQIEAQTKPPRIPEPNFGDRVMATVEGWPNAGPFFVRHRKDDNRKRWTDGHDPYAWSDLIDPVLVHPGIEDES